MSKSFSQSMYKIYDLGFDIYFITQYNWNVVHEA